MKRARSRTDRARLAFTGLDSLPRSAHEKRPRNGTRLGYTITGGWGGRPARETHDETLRRDLMHKALDPDLARVRLDADLADQGFALDDALRTVRPGRLGHPERPAHEALAAAVYRIRASTFMRPEQKTIMVALGIPLRTVQRLEAAGRQAAELQASDADAQAYAEQLEEEMRHRQIERSAGWDEPAAEWEQAS